MSEDDAHTGSEDHVRLMQLPERNSTRAAVDAARRALPVLIENADIMAQIRKANYDALVRAGFTEAQALDLCWR